MNTGVHIPRLATHQKHYVPTDPVERATHGLDKRQLVAMVQWLARHKFVDADHLALWRLTQRTTS